MHPEKTGTSYTTIISKKFLFAPSIGSSRKIRSKSSLSFVGLMRHCWANIAAVINLLRICHDTKYGKISSCAKNPKQKTLQRTLREINSRATPS